MKKIVASAVNPLKVLGDFRFLYLFVPATFVLMTDWAGFEALVQTFCVFYALLGLARIIRKLLIPYLDLEVFVAKASESSVGSAAVVCAILLFYLALTIIPIWWVSP